MNELMEKRVDAFARIDQLLKPGRAVIKHKPILGGVLGRYELRLGTEPSVRGGLDAVLYFVFAGTDLVPIAMDSTKDEALGQARDFLEHYGTDGFIDFVSRIRGFRYELDRLARERLERARAERKAAQQPSIPRRRREIFEKSEGKCHYCATALTLDGKWHIEHKMPKALMGGDEPSNLVASCVSCNHKKRDKTDQEFIAQRRSA